MMAKEDDPFLLGASLFLGAFAVKFQGFFSSAGAIMVQKEETPSKNWLPASLMTMLTRSGSHSFCIYGVQTLGQF